MICSTHTNEVSPACARTRQFHRKRITGDKVSIYQHYYSHSRERRPSFHDVRDNHVDTSCERGMAEMNFGGS